MTNSPRTANLGKYTSPVKTFIEFRKTEIEQSITDRFEEQVRRYSRRLAIKTKSQSLTYQQLNAASNRVAHSILARLGDTDRPVALLFKQGAYMIIASLGVLKAGKAYAPVDISLPHGKAAQVLQDLRASLILTDNDHISLAHQLTRQPCQHSKCRGSGCYLFERRSRIVRIA